jgi:hypothetical protein
MCAGDGTIDSVEYADFIKNLQPPEEPKHPHFKCSFPDTFILSEGALTSWWTSGPGNIFTVVSLSVH